MQPKVLNYADPKLRRRIRWKRAIALLVTLAVLMMLVNLAMDSVASALLPVRYVGSEVILLPTVPTAPSQAATHVAAIQSPAFLAPIAARHNIPLATMQRNLQINSYTSALIVVEYSATANREAIAIAQDIAATYGVGGGGPAWAVRSAAVPITRPHPWAKGVGYVQALACGLLMALLMRTKCAQRIVWHDV
jgi:hypothetical protein